MRTHTETDATRRLVVPAGILVALCLVGLPLTYAFDVGATPEGNASDVWARGSAVAPPMFLPVVLIVGVVLAHRGGVAGRVGLVLAGLVGVAVTLGGSLNLPADLDAARAADSPEWLTIALAPMWVLTAITIAVRAFGGLRSRPRLAFVQHEAP